MNTSIKTGPVHEWTPGQLKVVTEVLPRIPPSCLKDMMHDPRLPAQIRAQSRLALIRRGIGL